MSGSRIVHVGRPPSDFKEWTSTEVCFHNFADLSIETNEYEASPEFSSWGHEWKLDIYPGGNEVSPEGMVAVYLYNMSTKSIKIEYSYSIKNSVGKEVYHEKPYTNEFGAYDSSEDNGSCYDNFAKRSKLMKSLVNGTLVIEVRMRLVDTNKSIPPFIPQNPINKNVLELLDDEESADVVIEVGGQQDTGDNKRAKTSTTTFHAHRIILNRCAPALYDMCVSSDGGDDVNSIPITDVTPEIFRHMIHYIYGGKISEGDLKENAKEIIDSCDKYGVVGLKLEAEACYVKSTTISVDNMIDNLLYADSKNCALLKEAVIDFVVENSKDVLKKVSLKDVPGGVFADLLTAMAREKNEDATTDEDDLSTMRVSELRKKLDEKGLDVDGSREAMIARLKEQS